MIITFATQKGGTGKTTLAIAFANYLSLTGKKVHVYDFDYQKSFYQKWKDDEMLAEPKLYEVQLIDIEGNEKPFQDYNEIIAMKESKEIYLFDLAGNLDKKYADLLIYSDYLIIPFSYSDVSCHSTLVFINICGTLESESQLVFIRNGIDKNGRYRNAEPMDAELSKYGVLLKNSVYKRNCLQTITTRQLNYEERKAVSDAFEELIKIINTD